MNQHCRADLDLYVDVSESLAQFTRLRNMNSWRSVVLSSGGFLSEQTLSAYIT